MQTPTPQTPPIPATRLADLARVTVALERRRDTGQCRCGKARGNCWWPDCAARAAA